VLEMKCYVFYAKHSIDKISTFGDHIMQSTVMIGLCTMYSFTTLDMFSPILPRTYHSTDKLNISLTA